MADATRAGIQSFKIPSSKRAPERSTEQPKPIDISKIDGKARDFWCKQNWSKATARTVRDAAVVIGCHVPEAKAMAFRSEPWAGYCPVMIVLCPNGLSEESFTKARGEADNNGIVFMWTDDADSADFEISLKEPNSCPKKV
jgi:hypothetical protein